VRAIRRRRVIPETPTPSTVIQMWWRTLEVPVGAFTPGDLPCYPDSPPCTTPYRENMKFIAAFLTTLLSAVSGVEAKPLKVFILAGQSNMEGQAVESLLK
jgi:hypothetical protein